MRQRFHARFILEGALDRIILREKVSITSSTGKEAAGRLSSHINLRQSSVHTVLCLTEVWRPFCAVFTIRKFAVRARYDLKMQHSSATCPRDETDERVNIQHENIQYENIQ
jgi:hypothetical protein